MPNLLAWESKTSLCYQRRNSSSRQIEEGVAADKVFNFSECCGRLVERSIFMYRVFLLFFS